MENVVHYYLEFDATTIYWLVHLPYWYKEIRR